MKVFFNNERGFKRWVTAHPDGFVVKCERSRAYRKHRATCPTFKSKRPHTSFGMLCGTEDEFPSLRMSCSFCERPI